MVDEAHALGVIGATGKGIEEHFHYEAKVDIKLGTLSKAIPSMGGWVAGSAELVHHLRYAARPFLFSAALGGAQTGAALESLRIMQREPQRVEFIQRESARFRSILNQAGISTVDSETAVVPVIAGSDESAYDLATAYRKNGAIGLPVVTPAVPNDLARLRIAITAAHTTSDIDFAADALITSARECRII